MELAKKRADREGIDIGRDELIDRLLPDLCRVLEERGHVVVVGGHSVARHVAASEMLEEIFECRLHALLADLKVGTTSITPAVVVLTFRPACFQISRS